MFYVLVLFIVAAVDINALDAVQARTARHLSVLEELSCIGMDLARTLRAEVMAEPVEPPAPSRFGRGDPGVVFSRLAKAVRQTVALENHLANSPEQTRRDEARKLQEWREANIAQLRREEREEDIREFVGRAVERDAEVRDRPESDVERLLNDLHERLSDGLYDDALDGPTAQLVQRICHDLGISPDWRVWDDTDWGLEVLRNGLPEDLGAERWSDVYRLNEDGTAPAKKPKPDSS